MATHHTPTTSEPLDLGPGFRRAYSAALFIGGIAMALAIVLGAFAEQGYRRFFFAYLISYAFFLSIALGALLFVLVQHVSRAGWSVSVRRLAETLAATFPILAALSAPIVVSVILMDGSLYRWAQPVSHAAHQNPAASEPSLPPLPAQPAHGEASHQSESHSTAPSATAGLDALTLEKRPYLNPAFFLLRLLVYFAIWSWIGWWYWRTSVEQDRSGDVELTIRMERYSAPAILISILTLTFASFDLLMSLDPSWFSTIFGVYFFAGCAVGIFASLILLVVLLQRFGYLANSVTVEHFHDLGKFLFAFTFFWGYIAFSQYMLLWYANIPETTGWFARRGASSVPTDPADWRIVSLLLLAGHLLIPFAALLSRHVKRNKKALAFWAVWLLVFHWIDLFWIVMPEISPQHPRVYFGVMEIACFLGIGGIFAASTLRLAMRHAVRPVADPRLHEALVFQNI
ncbi:quinol:cytochrome C oxidoreductase [Fontivita pretiosa]|uniref:quinol:cytochrome C oxidoreductase n=1 Tax=Fontivita pretiosa TaxID=2989684 RepID=UPI003D1812D0